MNCIDNLLKSSQTAMSLYSYSKLGKFKMVERILSYNIPDINFQDDNGCTSLYVASQAGHSEVVKVLIHAGADIHLSCRDGSTPLASAACENRNEVCQILLNAGANINCTRNDGKTPLYIASWQGHIPILKTLILNGANVNQPSSEGITPIAISAFYGQLEVVKLLVKAHAKILVEEDKKSKKDNNPLKMARVGKLALQTGEQDKVVEYLMLELKWLRLRPLLLMRPHEDHETNKKHRMTMIGCLVTAQESIDTELFYLKTIVASYL